jgi:uncharacterized protein YdaU (DUF1376 family)
MSPQADRSPAFQFYARDFLSDVRVMAMSLEQLGAYWKLVSICWIEEGLPSDPAMLARLLHVSPTKMAKLWPAIEPCFRLESGLYQHPRLDRERAKQDEYRTIQSTAGKNGAAKRWAKARHSDPIDSPMAKHSSSSASSSASATAVKSVEHARPRPTGASGGSYMSQSNVAYSYRGHTLNRGPHFDAFVERFNGDREAFRVWLDAEIDACYDAGGRAGQMFRFIDERWEKRAPSLTSSKTAGNVAALQAFVKAGKG